MIQLENRYTKETGREYRTLRLNLLDALERHGLKPEFITAADGAIEDFGRQLATLGQAYIEPVKEITDRHADQQLGQMREFLPAVPAFSRLKESTELQRRALAERTLTTEPDWILSLRASLRSEAARMQASGEDEAAARKRLLADDIGDGRSSVYRRGQTDLALSSQSKIWSLGAGLLGMYYLFGERGAGVRFERQAIAAIDERTTDCCLRVHGQIVPLGKPFKLTGTPRFSDAMMNPPFHWFCRTSVALYAKPMEQSGLSTQELREAARAEMEARRSGGRKEIHPAHGTSRRT